MENIQASNLSDDPGILRDRFERQGLVVIPGFVSRPDLDRMNEAILGHYGPIVKERFGVDMLGKAQLDFECEVISWDPITEGVAPFVSLREDPRLRAATEAAIGAGFTAPRGLVMWSVGGGKGQAWHQDCPPDDPNAYNLNRLFYMQDTEVEDGAIVVVPGSHRRGRIPRGGNQEPIEGEITLTPRAGTLVLLHGHVFHRVTPNVSKRPRVSVNIRAYPSGTNAEVTRIGVYRSGAWDFREGKRVER